MEKYSYQDFLGIIETLRSENGCPWDREQTHETLRPCLMEEAAEVLAAIRVFQKTGDYANLREELGDVLLQVVMHAQIAKEEDIFTMEDVVHEVAEKMVRRHPHVFGTTKVKDSVEVLDNWEEIKKQEKDGKPAGEYPLHEIPIELPALTRAVKVEKKIHKLYTPGPDYAQAAASLREAADALEKLTPAPYDKEAGERIADALMAVADISRILKLTPEQILSDRVEEVVERFEKMP